jgi:hypothetical protein
MGNMYLRLRNPLNTLSGHINLLGCGSRKLESIEILDIMLADGEVDGLNEAGIHLPGSRR